MSTVAYLIKGIMGGFDGEQLEGKLNAVMRQVAVDQTARSRSGRSGQGRAGDAGASVVDAGDDRGHGGAIDRSVAEVTHRAVLMGTTPTQ